MDRKVILKKLQCGIKVLFVIDNTQDIVYFETCIRNGKLNQKPHELEYAHLLEHMNACFTSKKYPDASVNNMMLSQIGASTNAFTSNYLTRYYIKCNKKHRKKVFDLLMLSYMECVFEENVFYAEKQSVIEELQAKQNNMWTNMYNGMKE